MGPTCQSHPNRIPKRGQFCSPLQIDFDFGFDLDVIGMLSPLFRLGKRRHKPWTSKAVAAKERLVAVAPSGNQASATQESADVRHAALHEPAGQPDLVKTTLQETQPQAQEPAGQL